MRQILNEKNFILNKYETALTERLRLFMYATNSNFHRFVGISTIINFQSNMPCTLSEFNFHPFGFVLTLDSDPPRNDFMEITHFKNYEFDKSDIIKFKLPIIPISTIAAGYYP